MTMLSAGTCIRNFAGKLIAAMQDEDIIYIRNMVDICIRIIL